MFLPPITRPLFYLPAKLYAGGVRARAWLYERGWLKQKQLPAPVISIGNLTVGGTGKTPCVAWLANWLQSEGHAVAILSRGYKRASTGRVEVSDGKTLLCEAAAAGDEPYLLAQSCPGVRVIVDQDRYAAGRWLAGRAPVSVFLLDDGYQHLRLQRDLNLVLIDATDELARARMVPFGRLREPLTALRRADAVIVTRADQPFDRAALETTIRRHTRAQAPIFYAQHALTKLRRLDSDETCEVTDLANQPVAAFSGIARPERFLNDLGKSGMRVVWQRSFADHHRYTQAEFAGLTTEAKQAGAVGLLTTEKDAANLQAAWAAAVALPAYAAQLAFRCAEEAALQGLVLKTVQP
ncbi:MAG: tetraacyldisaccharide 4'-kinase [Acidobacteria bacterium]|nr:tetraacyldisaccharide 4'-kinase [Acidobacteriota bacterium]MBI3424980.1 tetraacyldisaccharide 4'-kinase [Acidobacteriota bacterium]